MGLQDRKRERPEAGLSQAVGMARKGDRAKPSRRGRRQNMEGHVCCSGLEHETGCGGERRLSLW